jgi:hypothetical protein
MLRPMGACPPGPAFEPSIIGTFSGLSLALESDCASARGRAAFLIAPAWLGELGDVENESSPRPARRYSVLVSPKCPSQPNTGRPQ